MNYCMQKEGGEREAATRQVGTGVGQGIQQRERGGEREEAFSNLTDHNFT